MVLELFAHLRNESPPELLPEGTHCVFERVEIRYAALRGARMIAFASRKSQTIGSALSLS